MREKDDVIESKKYNTHKNMADQLYFIQPSLDLLINSIHGSSSFDFYFFFAPKATRFHPRMAYPCFLFLLSHL